MNFPFTPWLNPSPLWSETHTHYYSGACNDIAVHPCNDIAGHSRLTGFNPLSQRICECFFDPPWLCLPVSLLHVCERMHHAKIFKGWPRHHELCKNIQGLAPPRCLWGTGTQLVHISSIRQISVGRKWRSQLCWVIKAVPHNLVRRIWVWKIKSSEHDFKDLYWTISKILFWNGFTSKGT